MVSHRHGRRPARGSHAVFCSSQEKAKHLIT
jgi:hypothetical protein